MKLIKPNFEILSPIDSEAILTAIELAGRTCYKSEDLIDEGTGKRFVEMLLKRGHESVLEHQGFSVKFICDRGVSHELVRHRIASFSQESTRYCNYSKDKFGNQLTFIIPPWTNFSEGEWDHDGVDVLSMGGPSLFSNAEILWLKQMVCSEGYYIELSKPENGWRPEQARSVLPNSLKTEIVVTANLREWRTIFKQRTASVAHPQMRELMVPLLRMMQNLLPVVFDDIIIKE